MAPARSRRADDRAAVHDGDPVAHAENLGQLGRDHQDRQPASGQLAHEPVDLGLGSDVDPLGRLVENEQRRLRRQPASQRHLLLVAAREVAHARFERGRLDPELADKPRGDVALVAEVEEPEPRDGAQGRQRGVGGRRHVENDTVAAAIFGDVGDSQGGRARRRIDRHGPAAEPDLTRVGGRQAEQDARQLGPARADQPGQPEDLAGPNAQADVAHTRGTAAQVLAPRGPPRPARRMSWERRPTTRGRPSCGSSRRATPLPSAVVPTRTPSRKAVTRSAICGQLFEAVGNVDDADPVRLQIADDPEKPVDLLVAERGRRLVHDQDAGVGPQAPARSRPVAARASTATRTSVSGSIVAPIFSSKLLAHDCAAGPSGPGASFRPARARSRCSRRPSGPERAPAAGKSRRFPDRAHAPDQDRRPAGPRPRLFPRRAGGRR